MHRMKTTHTCRKVLMSPDHVGNGRGKYTMQTWESRTLPSTQTTQAQTRMSLNVLLLCVAPNDAKHLDVGHPFDSGPRPIAPGRKEEHNGIAKLRRDRVGRLERKAMTLQDLDIAGASEACMIRMKHRRGNQFESCSSIWRFLPCTSAALQVLSIWDRHLRRI